MEEIYTNIYKESRKKAGMEQCEAAEAIGVSYHSLAKYEKKINSIVPPDDVVRNMLSAPVLRDHPKYCVNLRYGVE